MPALPSELQTAIDELAADRESGASDLLDRAVVILRAAIGGAAPVEVVARAVCAAQPSMAGLWNASHEAVASRQDPERFERFAQRLVRSGTALTRWGVSVFADEQNGPLRVVTCSASRSVLSVLVALARQRTVDVACAEGRPALEGRSLAQQLTSAGIAVRFYSDAAVGTALIDADAVLVGADAITPTMFLNKVGTRMLAAAAAQRGCPVYVAATRDKFLREPAARRLSIREGDASEIWSDAPAGVSVLNPYFEAIPLELISAVITDAGVLGTGMIADVCAAAPDDSWLDASLPENTTTQLP